MTTYERERYNALPLPPTYNHERMLQENQRIQRAIPWSDKVDLRDYGVLTGAGAGVAAKNAKGMQRALNEVDAGSTLYVPFTIAYDTTLAITKAAITLCGPSDGAESTNSARLLYTGAGAAIEIGADDGQPYDSGLYNGPQGFALRHLGLWHNAPDTTLASGLSSYKAGSYGIRDWRGGGINTYRASIRKFEYGFWGIESDINFWNELEIAQNRYGFYLGPRCDQNYFTNCDSYSNDILIRAEGARGGVWRNGVMNTNGSDSDNPVQLYSWTDSGRTSSGWVFDAPWLEYFGTFSGNMTVEAVFDIAVSDANQHMGFLLHDPTCVFGAYNQANFRKAKYLVKVGNVAAAGALRPHETGATTLSNLQAVFRVEDTSGATAAPEVYYEDHRKRSNLRLIESVHSLTTRPFIYSNDLSTFLTNSIAGTGTIQLQQCAFITSANSLAAIGGVTSGSASAGKAIDFNGPAADGNRRLIFKTAGAFRFAEGLNGDAESGADAGANHVLNCYHDDGTFIANVWTVYRDLGRLAMGRSLALKYVAPTYGTTITIDLSLGNFFDIVVTDGVGFTISAPTNLSHATGQRFTIRVKNTSGGVMGAIVWSTYKMAAFTNPTNGNNHSIDFVYNGSTHGEVGRTPTEVPN